LARRTLGKRGRLLFGAIVLAVVAAGVVGGRWIYESRLHALFAGEAHAAYEDLSGFYPTDPYDLTAYEKDEGGAEDVPQGLLEGSRRQEGYERVIEGGRPEYRLEASSGATMVARLRSPTAYRARWVPRFLTVSYPPEGAVFPPNLCAPFIDWHDANNDLWQVAVRLDDAFEWKTLVATRRCRIPDDVWRRVVDRGRAQIEVRGIRRKGWWGRARDTVHTSGVVHVIVSKDPADNVIVYRLVDPPFVNRKTPNIHARDIRRRTPRLLLDARQQYCFNCHAFSSKQGTTGRLSLQVRYVGTRKTDHLVYLGVYDIEQGRGNKVILPFADQMTTFMQWSPDGTKLALSANQQISGYYPIVYETQSIGQPTSDIGVYDATADRALLVPGASDGERLEVYPCWTPDGGSIVYSVTRKGQHPSQTQFDLMKVPYSDGRGGTPEPVRGAYRNGKSNFYARFSPDGRWMTFVKADYGSLIKASSDIWIMPADAGADPRSLACNAPFAADSWYSWSSNSRWIVFATKREDGLFARLYMTHIDAGGNASPAVRLPMEDPRLRMSFNIPEFVAEMPPIDDGRLFAGVSIDADVLEAQPVNVEEHGTEPERKSADR
jgi:Tol biopolymer transport system component